MTYVRHYGMTAKPSVGGDLEMALISLRGVVAALPGSVGVILMRDRADADRFVFIERWTDAGAWKAAGAAIPAEVMGQVKDALGAAPESRELHEVEA
jgi:quinol monooxygenase YgiN